MSNNFQQIEKAYSYCREVTRTHAKSFYFSTKFLPKAKQYPIYALYALCRHIDDEVDESGINDEQSAIIAVENWKNELEQIYSGKWQNSVENQKNLVLLAWQDVLKNYPIPQNLPLELMKGVLMDTHTKRYQTFDELYVYCYRVASVVGLMSCEIFGYSGGKRTLEYAEALGIAMQLTNILRDVSEDSEIGRIYLPQEDLQKFGVSEKQIFEKKVDDNFVELMKFEINRAREFYQKAELGIPFLNAEAKFAVLSSARLYAKILNEIEKQNYDVFAKRAYTTKVQKIIALPKIWLKARKL